MFDSSPLHLKVSPLRWALWSGLFASVTLWAAATQVISPYERGQVPLEKVSCKEPKANLSVMQLSPDDAYLSCKFSLSGGLEDKANAPHRLRHSMFVYPIAFVKQT